MRRREKQTEISFRLPILAYIGDHLEIIIMVHSHQSSLRHTQFNSIVEKAKKN